MRLFVPAPLELDLPDGWLLIGEARDHRDAFEPEGPSDYPLTTLLERLGAEAVYLPRVMAPPFYPRGLELWQRRGGLVLSEVAGAGGPRPPCAYPWQMSDGVVTQRPEIARRNAIRCIAATLPELLAQIT